MIKITDIDGRIHMLNPSAIAKISEAGDSGKWHGIQSYVKTYGATIEARESAAEIAALIDAALSEEGK